MRVSYPQKGISHRKQPLLQRFEPLMVGSFGGSFARNSSAVRTQKHWSTPRRLLSLDVYILSRTLPRSAALMSSSARPVVRSSLVRYVQGVNCEVQSWMRESFSCWRMGFNPTTRESVWKLLSQNIGANFFGSKELDGILVHFPCTLCDTNYLYLDYHREICLQ